MAPDQRLDAAVDRQRPLLRAALDRHIGLGEMQIVAAAPRQALGEDEQRLHPWRLGQPGRQRHGVRGTAEILDPDTLSLAGNLVGQNADRLVPPQGLHQDAHPSQVGRSQLDPAGGASLLDQRLQPALLRRPVEHRERHPVADVLGGDLEAAQVRREKHDAAPLPPGLLGQCPALHPADLADHFVVRTQPEVRQLAGSLADLRGRGPGKRCRWHAGDGQIGVQRPAIAGG